MEIKFVYRLWLFHQLLCSKNLIIQFSWVLHNAAANTKTTSALQYGLAAYRRHFPVSRKLNYPTHTFSMLWEVFCVAPTQTATQYTTGRRWKIVNMNLEKASVLSCKVDIACVCVTQRKASTRAKLNEPLCALNFDAWLQAICIMCGMKV